jgi:hypothetical protein
VSWNSKDYKGEICVGGEPQAVTLMGLINGLQLAGQPDFRLWRKAEDKETTLCTISMHGGAMYSFSAAFIMKCAFKQNKLRGKYTSAWSETDKRYHHLVKFQANEVLKQELAKLQSGSAKFALTIGGRDFECHMSRDPEVVEREAVARSQERARTALAKAMAALPDLGLVEQPLITDGSPGDGPTPSGSGTTTGDEGTTVAAMVSQIESGSGGSPIVATLNVSGISTASDISTASLIEEINDHLNNENIIGERGRAVGPGEIEARIREARIAMETREAEILAEDVDMGGDDDEDDFVEVPERPESPA